MDEAVVRVSLIAGALMVALLVVIVIRLRSKGAPIHLKSVGLAPGFYLFTSSACQGCGAARKAVTEALGENRFTELSWEQDPGEFHRLGVTAVPASLVVEEDDVATLYPGKPGKALQEHDH